MIKFIHLNFINLASISHLLPLLSKSVTIIISVWSWRSKPNKM